MNEPQESSNPLVRALRKLGEIQAGPAKARAERDEKIVRDAGYESMDAYQDEMGMDDPDNAELFEPMYQKPMQSLASVLQRLRGKTLGK